MMRIGISEIIITTITVKMRLTKINIMIRDTVNKILNGANKITISKNIKITINKNIKTITKIIHRLKLNKIIIITRRAVRSSTRMNHRTRQTIIKINLPPPASKLNNKSTLNRPKAVSSRSKRAIRQKRISLMAVKIRIRNEAYILLLFILIIMNFFFIKGFWGFGAEQADLAALGVGSEQVHDLDARLENLRFGGLVGVAGGRLMDGAGGFRIHRTSLVHGLADDVDDAAERAVADGHHDGGARVGHGLAAHEAFRRVHGDAAHGAFTQMLGHFQHEARALVAGLQRVEDLWQMALELHVDDGADDLGDFAGGCVGGGHFVHPLDFGQSASAPEMISISSLVIIA